ncbi:hypothetical protein DNH61_25210 [Paenibacillus sambharensis]|uniref:Thiopeptide-type bacteriocin biosynthesis domain-containing protein n=1 Tax=Paenibacillus sambharensis TaxID=1803190 RepID=A0A2W1LMR2_9BACL|nr:hypothetical protein [Paenibacillus sambharensis]PZD93081.1 hypothetical protein DNH61_25210 [Paenibacillus sambharensis]
MMTLRNTYEVTVYIYDSEMLNHVLAQTVQLLNKYPSNRGKFIIQKGWVYGPHFKVISLADESGTTDRNKFFQYIREIVTEYEKVTIEVDYERKAKITSTVALLENYKGEYLPLKKHLTVESGPFDENQIQSIFETDIYLEIESRKTEYFLDAYSYYHSLDEHRKEIFLVKLMTILTDIREKGNDPAEGGIRYGYLTYKSHYEGFLSQVKSKGNTKILEELKEDSPAILRFVEEQFDSYFVSLRSGFKDYEEADKSLLLAWKELIDHMIDVYGETIRLDKVKMNEFQTLNRFFEQNKEELSEFHQDIQKNEDLNAFLQGTQFMKYRFAVNSFYRMLPLYGVSPLRKHKLCKYVVQAVESYFDIDHKEVMQEFG